MVAIFPGVLKLQMAREELAAARAMGVKLRDYGNAVDQLVAWLLILFGVAVGVVSLVVEILKLTGSGH